MNNSKHLLTLSPANLRVEVKPGTRLQDVLFAQGAGFPCGGRGRCKGCRIKVLAGTLPVSDEEQQVFTRAELEQGWRLACRHSMAADLELEMAQWEMPVLGDHSQFRFVPRTGYGVAIDLGTTTIVGQLLDLETGNVLAVASALNEQARYGADIMSRIEYATHGGQPELERLIRAQLRGIVDQLLTLAGREPQLARLIIVGNTVMHHLFCGLDATALAGYPFQPRQLDGCRFQAADLDWNLPGGVCVEFLPCIGGFVGSDILAGIVATGLHESAELRALIDLGTNGEIVVGTRDRLLCASTAAGPAFEGARISKGMRAATGAIWEVRPEGRGLVCRVIGGGPARGLCGSGLVDAVATGLRLGWIRPDGRMTVQPAMMLADPVALQPSDVRELQLAKGAITAGLKMLVARLGATPADIRQLHLAGAFGNYISRSSGQRVGLLPLPLDRITPSGNTALLGAKRALFEDSHSWDAVRSRVEHVALHEDPAFEEIYAAEMRFPA